MRLVRSIIALMVCSVSTIHAAGQESVQLDQNAAAGRYKVLVVEKVEFHTRHGESLRDICRVGTDVYGCTLFPQERFEGKCALRQGRWVIDSDATITAVVHLSSGAVYDRVLLHERMHLADMEAGLRAQLDRIASLRYESASTCESVATVVSSPSYVRDVMNRLSRATNAKHRCKHPSRD